MPALVAGIHVFLYALIQDVGGRVKPGHDGQAVSATNRDLPDVL
jgi:hypothetical protein